jgi:hypothetical protein
MVTGSADGLDGAEEVPMDEHHGPEPPPPKDINLVLLCCWAVA